MLFRYLVFALFLRVVVPAALAGQTAYPPLEREPACQAIRAVSPQTRTLDVLYRASVCFNTTTNEMVIGWYSGGPEGPPLRRGEL